MYNVSVACAGIVLQASDKHSPSVATAGRMARRPGSATTSTIGRTDAPLFAGNMQGGLSNKYAGEPHLKDPLDPRCAPSQRVKKKAWGFSNPDAMVSICVHFAGVSLKHCVEIVYKARLVNSDMSSFFGAC